MMAVLDDHLGLYGHLELTLCLGQYSTYLCSGLLFEVIGAHLGVFSPSFIFGICVYTGVYSSKGPSITLFGRWWKTLAGVQKKLR